MFQKKKLRKEYDQRLLNLMESTKRDWLQLTQMEQLSYDRSDDLRCLTLLAKTKHFYLFQEAKKRKISIK
ncbi:YaaL family protein [Lederbergia graminis]|uniref:YaaL family protein n=1 Tax=Lederbergia graminis TaxID=735518 RepID=A0ABW0LGP8_9BACI|nr:YaaL family protein [Paenibacillus bovis]HLU23305.1 YaaL family protein [Bacillaceae bacterium]